MIVLPGKKCHCWVCLQDANYDSSWIIHQCGCQLQIHKKCYIRWLYSLNKGHISNQWERRRNGVISDKNLSKRLCYLLDGHRDFYRNISLVESIVGIPVVGVPCFTFVCIPMILSFETFGIDCFSKIITQYPLSPPITNVYCPQCKNSIKKNDVNFTSNSLALKITYFTKKIIRWGVVLATVTLPIANLGKLWFQLGLWQLRQLFPEEILTVLCDVSTTKALDVYGNSVNGILSIPDFSKIIIFGFPLYLIGLTAGYDLFNRVRWLLPLVGLKLKDSGNENNDVARICINVAYGAISLHNYLIKPVLNQFYFSMVRNADPYYIEEEEVIKDDIINNNYRNIVISSRFYDIFFQATFWPLTGNWIGGHMYSAFRWLQRNNYLRYEPNASPNAISMAFNFTGMGVASILLQFFKAYSTRLRVDELKEIQYNVMEVDD